MDAKTQPVALTDNCCCWVKNSLWLTGIKAGRQTFVSWYVLDFIWSLCNPENFIEIKDLFFQGKPGNLAEIGNIPNAITIYIYKATQNSRSLSLSLSTRDPCCQADSFLHVLLFHLQSLYQRRPPSSYIQVVRDAQRLPDVWLVIVESLLEDLPLRWPVSRLPPPVTDHDTDPGWGRQEMPRPWRKRGLQHHRRLTSKLPQVTNREGVNHNRPGMSTQS